LTAEAKEVIEALQQTISGKQAHRYLPNLEFKFIILGSLPHLHGLIFQWDQGERDPLLIIEWVFLPHQRSKSITKPQELMAQLITKARHRLRVLAGCDFACIHIPLKLETLDQLYRDNELLQFSLDSYSGKIAVHAPSHKLFNANFNLVPKEMRSQKPVKGLTVFTDASGASKKSVLTWKDPQTQQWEKDVTFVDSSPQIAELHAVVRAFEMFLDDPINIITDSAYVAGVVSRAEHAVLKEVSNPSLFHLLARLIQLLSHRKQPYYMMHVRSHTDLPGFIAEGNSRADTLAAPVQFQGQPGVFQQAKISHQQFHQNVPGLIRQFHLRRDQAKAIVATCPQCSSHAITGCEAGVNPRGLNSCEVWQTDITHVPEFGRLKYVHVSIDTFSGAVFASAHTGERSTDAKRHLMHAFAVLGIPRELKTDNGPAYVSRAFGNFLQKWGIRHQTGIPHSPTGQAIVERAHKNLK
ncbi:POK19 protein, partial [Oriolus oriolus]|nr:POK19 protein [Oriolus oriolus]